LKYRDQKGSQFLINGWSSYHLFAFYAKAELSGVRTKREWKNSFNGETEVQDSLSWPVREALTQ
jgi:hypothetical protein